MCTWIGRLIEVLGGSWVYLDMYGIRMVRCNGEVFKAAIVIDSKSRTV